MFLEWKMEKLENLKKRTNFRLVNNAKDYKKYVSKQSFISQKVFSEIFITNKKYKLFDVTKFIFVLPTFLPTVIVKD